MESADRAVNRHYSQSAAYGRLVHLANAHELDVLTRRRLDRVGLAYRSKFLIDTFDLHFSKDHLLLITVNTLGSAGSKEESALLLDRVASAIRLRGLYA